MRRVWRPFCWLGGSTFSLYQWLISHCNKALVSTSTYLILGLIWDVFHTAWLRTVYCKSLHPPIRKTAQMRRFRGLRSVPSIHRHTTGWILNILSWIWIQQGWVELNLNMRAESNLWPSSRQAIIGKCNIDEQYSGYRNRSGNTGSWMHYRRQRMPLCTSWCKPALQWRLQTTLPASYSNFFLNLNSVKSSGRHTITRQPLMSGRAKIFSYAIANSDAFITPNWSAAAPAITNKPR